MFKNAIAQARNIGDPTELLKLQPASELHSLKKWILPFKNNEKIADLILSYKAIFNVEFQLDSDEWNGLETLIGKSNFLLSPNSLIL